jgi:hypothetical protein
MSIRDPLYEKRQKVQVLFKDKVMQGEIRRIIWSIQDMEHTYLVKIQREEGVRFERFLESRLKEIEE